MYLLLRRGKEFLFIVTYLIPLTLFDLVEEPELQLAKVDLHLDTEV